METQGYHRVNIIKLQMFEWSHEWDCRGQISLPTGMGGKLKTPLAALYGSRTETIGLPPYLVKNCALVLKIATTTVSRIF